MKNSTAFIILTSLFSIAATHTILIASKPVICGQRNAPTLNLQAQIDALPPEGGQVVLPAGHYWLDETIDLRGRDNVRILGAGIPTINDTTGTVLHARHGFRGNPVIDMTGAESCVLDSFEIRQTTTVGFSPECAILLARTPQSTPGSPPSAGLHQFNRIRIYGRWTIAGVVNVGSEDNLWSRCHFMSILGTPSYWSSSWNNMGITADIAGGDRVGGGGAISNVQQTFRDCTFGIPEDRSQPERFADSIAVRIDPRNIRVLFDACNFTGRQPCRAAILITGTEPTNLDNASEQVIVRDAYTELFGARSIVECTGPAVFRDIQYTGRDSRRGPTADKPPIALTHEAMHEPSENYTPQHERTGGLDD